MALKLFMNKAYDHGKVMTTFYSVLVNGSPKGYIRPTSDYVGIK